MPADFSPLWRRLVGWLLFASLAGAWGAPPVGAAAPAPGAASSSSPQRSDDPESTGDVSDEGTKRDADAPSSDDAPSPDLAQPVAPARPLLPGVAGQCGLDDSSDPLVPVAQTLESLKPAGYIVGDCRIDADALRGRALQLTLAGTAHDLLFYLLDQVAVDGFALSLAPVGTDRFELTARPAPDRRGLRFVRVQEVRLQGADLDPDTRAQVRRIAELDQLNFVPMVVQARLREIGYRSDFVPTQPGIIEIRLAPARSIRRVRIFGNRGLPEREILRALSPAARPGALSRGRCVAPNSLRAANRAGANASAPQGLVTPSGRPPICAPDDFACRQWEDDELDRLERYLFSSGHLRGTASLALACGRAKDEVDLHVYVDSGPAYRIDRNAVSVVGEPREEDEAWIRRRFIPRTLLFFRTAATRDAMDEARDEVTSFYAQPGRARTRVWRDGAVAYPEVEVSSSYEQLTRQSAPLERDLPLEVRIDPGLGLTASFTRVLRPDQVVVGAPEDESSRERRAAKRPSFSDTQLAGQLQIFTRRDTPNRSTAVREAANIRAFYQRKGFLFADVGGELVETEDADRAQLQFRIYEGPKVRIKQLEVVRPQGPSDEEYAEIRGALRDEAQLRKRGSFSEREALDDLSTLLSAYNAAGYLCASAHVELAFWPEGFDQPGAFAVLGARELIDAKNRPSWVQQLDPRGLKSVMERERASLYVRVVVEPGPQVTTSRDEELRYLEEAIPRNRRVEGQPTTSQASWGSVRILRETPLRRDGSTRAGQVPLNLDLEEDTRKAIASRYRNDGFPLADAELSWVWRRPDGTTVEVEDVPQLADPSLGLCREASDARSVAVDAVVSVYEGRRGRHGDLLLRGNFKTQDRVLLQQVEIEPGAPYSERDLQRSLAQIEAIGVSRSVRLTPYPVGCELQDEDETCVVHQVLTMEESRDVAVDVPFGVGGATLNPFYVFAKPSFPNMGGSAWNLEFDGRFGLFWIDALPNPNFCDNRDCYEHNLRSSLLRPRIGGSSVDFEITGRYQQRVTPARGRIDSAYGALRFTWRLAEGLSVYAGYLFQIANVSEDLVKPLGGGVGRWFNRGAAIVSDRAGLLETGLVWSRVDNAFNPSRGFIAAADFKLASPFLAGLDWFARVDLRWQHFVPIPRTQDRLDFRYSLTYGHGVPFSGPLADTKTIPDIWRYYGGGTAALGLRGLAPETMLVDIEEITLPYGGTVFRPRAQGGQIRAIGTLAFQVVSLKDFLGGALAHSVFYDFGVLTQFWEQVQFPRDYRHSAGVNALKWDIKLVTLALGYAWLLPTRGNIGPTDDPNGRVVFDVGITF